MRKVRRMAAINRKSKKANDGDEPTVGSIKLRATGLWLEETNNGGKCLRGKLAPGLHALIYKNREKKGNQPDYVMYLEVAGKVHISAKEKEVEDNEF